MKVKTSKGFTLAELLIVMAIIVVLAAVAIPTFGKQLETSRETGDMEVIRNAYTEALSIATLDGADGAFNGKFGDGAAEATTGTWGAVTFTVASSTNPKAATADNGPQATYVVNLEKMGGAKFAQATLGKTSPASADCWKYTNAKLADHTVPYVHVGNTDLKFTFELTADGDVVLKKDGSTESDYAIVAS